MRWYMTERCLNTSASVNNMLDTHLSEEMCCLEWYCAFPKHNLYKIKNSSWLHHESIDTVSGKLVISWDFRREFGGGGVRRGSTWMWPGTGTAGFNIAFVKEDITVHRWRSSNRPNLDVAWNWHISRLLWSPAASKMIYIWFWLFLGSTLHLSVHCFCKSIHGFGRRSYFDNWCC